ncbi:MAG: right-handed parallel beta-helix repeat-containing protein [Actinomycetota bacterium]|nr:right-handed parallel beta-helix repeat-containing protein [Actinomycetota bacterium]
MRTRSLIAAACAFGLLAASCGGSSAEPAVEAESTAAPQTTAEAATTTEAPAAPAETTTTQAPDPADDGILEVPGEYPTIQAAVDAASSGDLVLIAPGVYNESVDVETDGITIRGISRNEVILDGQTTLDNGIRVLGASNVAVENLTAINYTNNSVFWIGSTGYRASYVTTQRTGDYGIYAFDSTDGLIEHSFTSGSKDAGIYIGQCYPCNAVVHDIISEHNGLGYSGTNSGGELYIVDSVFRNNRVGIVPNSGSYELCYPQRRTTIVGNLVHDNNQDDTPAIDVALLAMGNGILVAGGIGNVIERNLVFNHARTGIGAVPFLEDTPNDDIPGRDEWDTDCATARNAEITIPDGAILWDSFDNVVRDNVVSDSGAADLAVASVLTDTSTLGNCFEGNTFATSAPSGLESKAPCGSAASGDWAAGALNVIAWLEEQASMPPSVDWKTAELPEIEAQPDMPDAATAPADPSTASMPEIDIDGYGLPDDPRG